MKGPIQAVFFGFIGAMLFSIVKPVLFPSIHAAPATQVLTVSGLNVVDRSGKIRIQLGFSGEGPPGIWVLDDKGIARVLMGLYSDQTSYFGLQDKNGLMIELMRSVGANETPLLIFKHKGSDKMITGLDSNAKPFLQYDDVGAPKNLFGAYAK